ncbi:MAG: hypothetical protein K8J08_16015 [Thermoanaerobaculia bacterium]|nr:hypothetical protein [Thermoanaerobaculia bacterium]
MIPVSTSVELRDALAGVQEGDVIEVAPGSYTPMGPSGQLFFLISNPNVAFTVRAETPGTAFIDGGGSRRLVEFTITNPSLAGWVTFEGLVFRNGKTTTIGNSGGIMMRGAKATFVDCVFQNNSAVPTQTTGPSSGAVHISSEGDVQFIDCQFLNNTTTNHGGAMLVGQGSRVVLQNSLFLDNLSNVTGHLNNSLGGAIHVYNSLAGSTTRLQVLNTRFEGNEAAFAGGGIMAKGDYETLAQPLNSHSEVLVVNSTFVDNVAVPSAGGTTPSPPEGGAIMAENDVTVIVIGSRFWNNEAAFGGAIASHRSAIEVTSSEFRTNVANGRSGPTEKGRGGAIAAHSNDICTEDFNYPPARVEVTDSFFEGNQSQLGGCLYVVGDKVRESGACQDGTTVENRAPMTVSASVFSNCSVDDIIPSNSLGGALYGLLVDLDLTDTMVLGSSAFGIDTTDPNSVSKGMGGGATFRTGSLVNISNTVFAGNSADHEGGGLHIYGSDIGQFANNVFVGNEVSPGGMRTETTSRGAAVFVGPDLQDPLDSSGSLDDSYFAGNSGLAIFDHDTTCPSPCNENFTTYEGNVFDESSFGSDVFFNPRQAVFSALTPSELNAVVINRGSGGTPTNKSPAANNSTGTSNLPVGFLRAAPTERLSPTAFLDPNQNSESFAGWGWNGGCAEFDGFPQVSPSNHASVSAGVHSLMVFSGACTGSPAVDEMATVLQAASPAATFVASPSAISSGQSSTLSWNLTAGSFVAGLITHDASMELPAASGNVVVTPDESTRYHLVIVTDHGGVVAEVEVLVDDAPADEIFSDGFESGSTSGWSSSS